MHSLRNRVYLSAARPQWFSMASEGYSYEEYVARTELWADKISAIWSSLPPSRCDSCDCCCTLHYATTITDVDYLREAAGEMFTEKRVSITRITEMNALLLAHPIDEVLTMITATVKAYVAASPPSEEREASTELTITSSAKTECNIKVEGTGFSFPLTNAPNQKVAGDENRRKIKLVLAHHFQRRLKKAVQAQLTKGSLANHADILGRTAKVGCSNSRTERTFETESVTSFTHHSKALCYTAKDETCRATPANWSSEPTVSYWWYCLAECIAPSYDTMERRYEKVKKKSSTSTLEVLAGHIVPPRPRSRHTRRRH